MSVKAWTLKFWQFLTEIFAFSMQKFHPEAAIIMIGILLAQT